MNEDKEGKKEEVLKKSESEKCVKKEEKWKKRKC